MELYVNGRVLTCDPAQPSASAVAVRDGRIVAVGEEAASRSAAGPEATTVDLGGRTMVPGLIDAHNHMACTAETFFAVDALSLLHISEPTRRVVISYADF
jgi:predicted amidohydrolase YtcJ